MSLIDLIRKGPIASANANFANAAIPQVENDAGLARLATLALAKAATDRGKERDTNRAQFPFTSEKLDDLRAHFGNGVRVAYAKEGEREIGSPLARQELDVPFSKLERRSPGTDCSCSSCQPSKTRVKRTKAQSAPGEPFGLDRHGQFSQPSSYRQHLHQQQEMSRFVGLFIDVTDPDQSEARRLPEKFQLYTAASQFLKMYIKDNPNHAAKIVEVVEPLDQTAVMNRGLFEDERQDGDDAE